MVSNNQDDGTQNEFEDEVFDETEFSDADMDDTAFDEGEYAALEGEEGEFADEDFVDEEWQEEPLAAKGREKTLYSSGEKKGLSFNTMVIIGAVVLGGGVMMMTIMNKSAQVAAGQPGMFQSLLDISGVMDGTLFGEKEVELTAEEQAAQEQNTQQQGFLNNPGVLDGQNPPQPAPIAPPEDQGNTPLVPLPQDGSGSVPRGPDEMPPGSTVAISETPIQPITPISPDPEPPAPAPVVEQQLAAPATAEDILKQAIANREKKQEAVAENNVPAAQPAPVPPVTPEPAPTQPEATQTPAPNIPAQPAPVVDTAQTAANAEALVANTKAMEALGTRIEEMMGRIQKIETDLGSVKDSKSSEYQQLEQSLSGLKQEVQSIKDRPVPAPSAETPKKATVKQQPAAPEPEEVAEVAPEPAPVKKTVKKASKPKTAANTTPKSAGTAYAQSWELRAAQPGRAWISKPGTRDMQGVQVGQTISGLGRITAITFQGGRWAVIGTQGQIRQ